MHIKKTIIAISNAILGILAIIFLTLTPAATQDTNANNFVSQLSSANNDERQVAKNELVKLGNQSAAPLISLLENLIKDPRPRFNLGQEKEGNEYFKHLDTIPPSETDIREHFSIDISWRLKLDVIDLLGQLKAEEGIPLLIQLVKREEMRGLFQKMRPEMSCLVKIGRPAVPQLIDAIEQSMNNEHAILYNPAIPESYEYAQDTATPAGFTEEEWNKAVSELNLMFHQRVAMILGEIGDEHALSILEKVLDLRKTSKASGDFYIEAAVEKIKKNANSK